jgi:S1-C subfamily serine protease
MQENVPARVPFFLFFLFFIGLALSVLAVVDLRWTHWVLVIDRPKPDRPSLPPDPEALARLRPSILNVRIAQCSGNGENVGTAFVVKAGYVATAAHILGDQQTCNGKIRLIDFKGREHAAALDGVAIAEDLALLRISDTTLPPLQLADPTPYESPNEVVRLVTIGYPLEQEGASTQDSAAISGEGTLSRFDREHNVFVTSGLNLNPGNSGGPIFLRKNWQVLGIARAKLAQQVGDGIAYVASIKTFEAFFREKTGQDLR